MRACRPLALAVFVLLAPALAGCLSPPAADEEGSGEAGRGGEPPRPPRVVFEPQPRVELEASSTDPAQTRAEDEFWMVWVRGHETREAKPGRAEVVCTILWDHDVDPEQRRLTYSREHDFDVEQTWAVSAVDHFARWNSCPIAYTVHAAPHVEEDMGRYGPLAFVVHRDGSLELHGGTRVPLGQRAVVTYEGEMTEYDDETYHVNGTFTVENLGAWPKANLERR